MHYKVSTCAIQNTTKPIKDAECIAIDHTAIDCTAVAIMSTEINIL